MAYSSSLQEIAKEYEEAGRIFEDHVQNIFALIPHEEIGRFLISTGLALSLSPLRPSETFRQIVQRLGKGENFTERVNTERLDQWGFEDWADMHDKIELLRKAWEGVIDVTIDTSGLSSYISIVYSAPEEQPS